MGLLDFYGSHVGKYTIVPWMLWEDRLLGRRLYFGSPSKSWRCRFEIGDLEFSEDFEISGGFWNRCRPAFFFGNNNTVCSLSRNKTSDYCYFFGGKLLSERPLVAFCMKFFFCQTFASKDMKKYFAKVRALKPEVSWFSSSNSQSLSPCFCGSFQPNSCALAQKKSMRKKAREVWCVVICWCFRGAIWSDSWMELLGS